jgi:hypothetical protein
MNSKIGKFKFKDITPKNYKCGLGPACPAVFTTNQDTYMIVGKTLERDEALKLLGNKVGKDETVILVPKGLINDIFEK